MKITHIDKTLSDETKTWILETTIPLIQKRTNERGGINPYHIYTWNKYKLIYSVGQLLSDLCHAEVHTKLSQEIKDDFKYLIDLSINNVDQILITFINKD